MRYAILIYDENTANPSPEPPSPEVFGEVMSAYNGYTQMLKDKGVYEAGEALQPATTATSIRIKDGQTITTDGPFAETKEGLGASTSSGPTISTKRWAWRPVPRARFGATIEVRPVMDVAYPQESAQTSVGRPRAEPRHRRHPRYRRPPVPRGAGTGGRDAHPRPRRLRLPRGGGPGRVHRRTRGLARPRHPGNRVLDHDETARNRAIDRIRRRRRLRRQDRRAGPRRGDRGGSGGDRARHRSTTTTCRSPTIDCA